MAILAGAILRTAVNFNLGDGTLFQNVYHHQRIGPGLALTDQQHVDAIEAWAETMYAEINAPAADNIVEGLSTVDRVEFVGGEWTVTESIGTFVMSWSPIGSSVTAMPNQMSPFVTFRTARPKTVGRKFLFPLIEGSYTSGVLHGGTVTEVVAYADDAVNDITVDAPLDFLVPGVVRTGVDEFLEFSVAIVTDLAGTQRRRRRGYGA